MPIDDKGRSERLEIRVEPTEKAAFQTAAELSGLGLSSWIRERLRRVAQKELEGADIPVPWKGRTDS